MKIQTKIALMFASLAAGILLTAGLFLYYLINQNTFDDFYKRLEIRAIISAKARLDNDAESSRTYSTIRAQHLEELLGEQEYFIPLTDGNMAAARRSLPDVPAVRLQQAITEGHSMWRKGHTFYYLLRHTAGTKTYLVAISARNELSIRYLNFLRRTMLLSFMGAVLLAFTVGLLFSKSMLGPIRSITGKVRRLSASNLHLRLDVKPGTDEISELAATFNNMLDRLETAFETQNNFVSHASHEFNTPLTAIIGEAEYALARPRSPEQYAEAITNMHAAAEKLSSITRSLLQLAQTGLTGKVQEMAVLQVEELLQKVCRMTDDIMPGNKVFINHSLAPADMQPLMVWGNQTLLELAIANVVLNACKYSSNKPVQFALAATNDKVLIIVRDEGIGIPEDELKYIFNPFFRARNTGTFKGYGIGLPLTRNIIRMHNGEVIVHSREAIGTEIQLVLPLASRTR